MRKRWSLILRIVFAVAGVAIIALSVDWVDKVEVRTLDRAGGGEPVVVQRQVFRVTAGEVDPSHQAQDLTAEFVHPDGRIESRLFPAAQLDDSDEILLRPSFLTTLEHANIWLLVLGLVLVAPIYPIQTYRWLVLMKARGLDVTYGKAFRLTLVGCFFNYSMPGSTGGDLVKAYYSARNSDRRTDSIMSVIVDRVTGLIGLILVAGVVGLFTLDEPVVRKIAVATWTLVAVATICAVVYFKKSIRRFTGLDWLMHRVPGGGLFRKIDDAALAYKEHKGAVLVAVLVSLPVHLMLAASTAVAGYAVGMDPAVAKFGLLMTVVPTIFLSGSLPITPQGAGVWELLGKAMLFHPPAVTMNQIVAMLMMARLYQLTYSLAGSVFLLKGDIHLHPEGSRDAKPVAV